MLYPIKDLTIRTGGEEELERVFSILSNILAREKEGKKLTEHEKEFFCKAGIKQKMIPGTLDDYACCVNFKFTDIYLSYWYDLLGNSSYTKMRKGVEYTPSITEIRRDIDFLNTEGRNWEKVIKIENHSEKLLLAVATETRKELKRLSNSIGRAYFRRQKEELRLNKLKTLLQSKHIYCRSLLVLEKFQDEDYELSLNNQTIEIDENSIVHILSQHFAEMTKYNSEKTFHNENFNPDYLNIQIADIFRKIDESKLFIKQDISKISFKFNDTIYQMWINKRTKQVKGFGNVEFNRLDTFYPLEEKDELANLSSNFTLKMVTDDIGIYINN